MQFLKRDCLSLHLRRSPNPNPPNEHFGLLWDKHHQNPIWSTQLQYFPIGEGISKPVTVVLHPKTRFVIQGVFTPSEIWIFSNQISYNQYWRMQLKIRMSWNSKLEVKFLTQSDFNFPPKFIPKFYCFLILF